jgi:hypothetical protein
MHIAIDLPDDIVATLQATCPDMTRLVLESLALEGYRSRQLSTEQVRQLLGFETRFGVYDFLGAHEVPFYTLEDLKHDLDTLDRLGA